MRKENAKNCGGKGKSRLRRENNKNCGGGEKIKKNEEEVGGERLKFWRRTEFK